jgi:archaellum component FlaC
MEYWHGVVAVVLSIFGAAFALYKWGVVRRDKQRLDINTAQDRSIEEHAARLNRHSERLEKLEEMIQLLRQELQQNYPKLDRIEALERSISEELGKVHNRLSGIARDLNRTMGQMQATHDSEITHLIERISKAVEASHRD